MLGISTGKAIYWVEVVVRHQTLLVGLAVDVYEQELFSLNLHVLNDVFNGAVSIMLRFNHSLKCLQHIWSSESTGRFTRADHVPHLLMENS